MPKVSLILPVYNVEKYIEDCILSIINQTNRNFELIIVDDETKDSSIEIAENLMANTEIEYRIIKRKNGGLSAARNSGIKAAKGDYLSFIDSDDVINPNYVETLLSDIEKNNVMMAIGSFKWVTDVDKLVFDTRKITGEIVNKNDFLQKILKRKIFNYFGCFMISRKYILDNNLWFDETVFFGVDQAYMWRLMVGVPQYTYNSMIVYNYYNRPNSIMTATKINKMLTGLPSLEKCAFDLKANPYFDSKMIVARWKVAALHTIAKNFSYQEFKDALTKFKPSSVDCLMYPDLRIKMLSLPMLTSSKILYHILRKH